MKEAVIVAMGRSAVGRAFKGSLKDVRPEDLGAQVLKGVLDKVPNLNKEEIDDIIVGCAFPEAEQGMNMAKIIAARAGLPKEVAGQTVNRFCSSGLQSIATAANSIMTGQSNIIVAGGVESMSTIPMGGNQTTPDPYLINNRPEELTTMGITAENVAKKYGVSRAEQDEFALESHLKGAEAIKKNKYEDQIIPIKVNVYNPLTKQHEEKIHKLDEGIRANTSLEQLSKLRPVFNIKGSVTAANSSQMSDGAGFVVLMSKEKAQELNLKIIAKFKSFAVAGVDAKYMGLGPIEAVPKALKIANMNIEDIDVIEINEAFASQSIACIKDLGLDKEKVNINGGAISQGHPLGATGTILTIKALSELKYQNKKNALVTMCIGGGMGAAGIFEIQ